MGLKAITTRFASPTFTGVSKFADGSAAAPSVVSSTVSTTGLYWDVVGRMAYSLAGTVQFTLPSYEFRGSSTYVYSWASAADPVLNNADAGMTRAGANSILFGGASNVAGAVTSRTEINKAVTAFSNAVAKAVFTITIPNAAHSASIMVRVTGSLGAGGAIGANEATATNCYVISLTRTAGVNATAAISSAFGAAATAVAGAATVTCTAAMSSVSGAVGDPNTFTVDVTITRSGGSSDSHTCVAHASLLNANATGITIA